MMFNEVFFSDEKYTSSAGFSLALSFPSLVFGLPLVCSFLLVFRLKSLILLLIRHI